MSSSKHMTEIIECVVNISEGRDQAKISQISQAITCVPGTTLLHIDSGYDANRTVFTFVADRVHMRMSVLSMFQKALDLIDMTTHRGEHPRIGAIDVCPFIPVAGISKEDLISWTYEIATLISNTYKLPIYLYEDSSIVPHHHNLSDIRKGDYEGLITRVASGLSTPDLGFQYDISKFGATVMGVRSFLLAYNINLKTKDPGIAKKIAKRIRGSGYTTIDGGHTMGIFPTVKAIGWYMKEYCCAQVSTNLTDYHHTSFHDVYDACATMAIEYGTEVNGSELIGLTPLEALLTSGIHYGGDHLNEQDLIQAAVDGLGLSSLTEFIASKRIIEYML